MKSEENETIIQTLKQERLAFSIALNPRVSKKEMQGIREQIGLLSDYNTEEFLNMKHWVRNGAKLK